MSIYIQIAFFMIQQKHGSLQLHSEVGTVHERHTVGGCCLIKHGAFIASLLGCTNEILKGYFLVSVIIMQLFKDPW